MQDNTLRRILAFFVAIFALVVVVAVAALVNINRAGESRDWVNHTYATISAFENILGAVRGGDGDMRAYALSGNPADLASSREAFANMDEYVQVAQALTRDDAEVQPAMREIASLANQRAELAEAVAQARRENQPERVRALLNDDAGSVAMDAIRRRIEQLRDGQFARLRQRENVAYRQAVTTRWVVGAGVACNLVLFGAVAWLIRDDLRARQRAARVLEEANAQLETKVRERTAELSEANQRLTAENFERKWAAQSQEHQLRYNQAIIDAVSDLVFVLTRSLAISRVNPAAVRAAGRDEGFLVGKPLREIVRLSPPGNEDMRALERGLASGRDQPGLRVKIGSRDGQLSLYPLRDRDKVVGAIAVVQLDPHPDHPARDER